LQKLRSRVGFAEALVLTVAVVSVLVFVTWQLASTPVTPEVAELQDQVDFLSKQLDSVVGRLDRAQARVAVLERESEVMRRANDLLREKESERQAEMNRLNAELDFYRRLAGTGGAQTGLDVYRVELVPTDSDRVFQFVLTLTQNIRRASIITGRARIDVEGVLGDRPVTLYWSEVSDGDTPEPSFRFKYFQQLEGYLTLPDDFSPTRLVVTLESKDHRDPVVRDYDWPGLITADTD